MSSYFQTFSFPLVVNNSLLPVSMLNKTPSEILVQDQQKLALVIEVKPFKPIQLTEEFLKQESIIPCNWTQKKNGISNSKRVQLDFEEGITIIGELNQLIIQESIAPQNLEKMVFATVAHHLIEKLNTKNYTKIQLQFQRSFSISNIDNFGITYLKNNLLSSKLNQGIGNPLISGEISYVYRLDKCQLKLKVKAIQKQHNISPSLNFIGNFNYQIEWLSLHYTLEQQVQLIISNWQLDYHKFTNLINTNFLG